MKIIRFLLSILLFLPAFSLAEQAPCIHYSTKSYIHITKIDLTCPTLKWVVNSPSEKGLSVSQLAEKYQTTVAINANFFSKAHSPIGLVVADGKVWQGSRDTRSKVIFACDKQNKCVIEPKNRQTKASPNWRIAVSGWQYYDAESKTFSCAANDHIGCAQDIYTAKHPRTMLGLDEKNNTLYLVVVEGRQLLYRGMDLPELAKLAGELGLTKAINLDGGGSSAMVWSGKRVSSLPLLQSEERKIANFLGVRE